VVCLVKGRINRYRYFFAHRVVGGGRLNTALLLGRGVLNVILFVSGQGDSGFALPRPESISRPDHRPRPVFGHLRHMRYFQDCRFVLLNIAAHCLFLVPVGRASAQLAAQHQFVRVVGVRGLGEHLLDLTHGVGGHRVLASLGRWLFGVEHAHEVETSALVRAFLLGGLAVRIGRGRSFRVLFAPDLLTGLMFHNEICFISRLRVARLAEVSGDRTWVPHKAAVPFPVRPARLFVLIEDQSRALIEKWNFFGSVAQTRLVEQPLLMRNDALNETTLRMKTRGPLSGTRTVQLACSGQDPRSGVNELTALDSMWKRSWVVRKLFYWRWSV